MSVNINRMYKAMHRVDPEGKYRWYVRSETCGDVTLEAMSCVDGVASQATCVIYGHSSRYDQYFQKLYDKLEKITKVLDQRPE